MAKALTPEVRCLRLRLSVLLILALLSGLPGCKGDGLSEVQREQQKTEAVINDLREQGATVTPKSYPPRGNGYVVDLSGAQLTDHTFQTLKDLQRVTELDLSKSSLTDDQMDQLNQLASVLLRLDLSNTKVTDAGLEKLTNLKICMNLNLVGTQVTPAGAERFKQQHKRPASKRSPISEMKIRLR